MDKDFKFHKRELLYALSEKAIWGDRRQTLQGALSSIGKKTLSKKDLAVISKALSDYQFVDEAFILAGLHANALFPILDSAGKEYKAGNRSYARILGWAPASKKRGKSENSNSIIATYLLHVGMGYTPDAALEHIIQIFELQSRPAVIKRLQREKKRLTSLPLPSIHSEKKPIPFRQKPTAKVK